MDHPSGGHDDHADALCRAAAVAMKGRRVGTMPLAVGGVTVSFAEGADAGAGQRLHDALREGRI